MIKKHAYLVLAHNNFYNLKKLLLMLDDERNDIYIHIDKKVKQFDFDGYRKLCNRATVQYTRRINVRWGHQSLVLAELELFDLAYKNGPYHYYHLISGADLPLKSQNYIHDFFLDKSECYLHQSPTTSKWDRQRMSIFHLVVRPRNGFEEKIRDWVNQIQLRLRIDRLRKCPMTIIKGWEWGSLPHTAVQILVSHRREISRFTKHTLCSDEVYKQTLISHYGGTLSENDQHLIRWDITNSNHPLTFQNEDFALLCCTPHLFARKFDERVDKQIIDMIFDHVMQQDKTDYKLAKE